MDGLLVLEAARHNGRTHLARVRYEGTARASRAFEDGRGTRVMVSTLGPGALGGDRITIDGTVGPGAHMIVTSQSATRVYGPGTASHCARWTVAAGATLELRLEPLMLFADADYLARTEIELAPGARLWAIDVAGLAEEAPARARIVTVVRREGRLVLRDALALDAATLAGGAAGSLIAFGFSVSSGIGDTDAVRVGVGTTLAGGRFLRATGPRVWDVNEALRAHC